MAIITERADDCVKAVGQLCSGNDLTANLSTCKSLVKQAVEAGAKALFLPEASDYIALSPTETISLVRSIQESEFVIGLQEQCRSFRLPINVGIHEPANNGERVTNTSIWINEEGVITQRYEKIHLFDVDLRNGPTLKESALSLRRQGAQIITYPSAFTIPTGKAHWEVLLRARAIEAQSYIVAAAQVGQHNPKRISYGYSMIINPWGKVVAQIEGDDPSPAIAVADVDLELLHKVRNEMPLLRRTDIYPEV
ncbi:Carbon-nitrogen hydrolase [Myotisia sp. PD_48]|nr:Carbon-nitrogen hydrolase [Myotisia sp. PD_48]